jgi:hypothetical protein
MTISGGQRTCACALCACGLALATLALGAPASAGAAPYAPITGTLDKAGYTVIAAAPNGSSGSAVAPTGAFSIVPTAPSVTLHLRAPDGTYAGMILPRPKADMVAQAKLAVTSAMRAVTKAKKAVTKYKRAYAKTKKALRRAKNAKARRLAAKRVKQARLRLKKANSTLRRTKVTLTARKRALLQAQNDAAARASAAPLGVKPGAALGAIRIDAGYAVASELSESTWKRFVDTTRTAQSALGLPIGIGNFGLVRSTRTDGGAVNDTDLDGVPDSLDIDDDGDLILDDYDTTAATARAAQGGRTQFSDGSHLQAVTALGAFRSEDAVNADGGSTDQQIFASERRQGVLEFLWSGLDEGSGEIDCGALSYCSAGGTGAFGFNSVPPAGSRDNVQPFPGAFDGDGDGFGSLVAGGPSPAMPAAGGRTMGIYHGATAEEIQAGDVLIEKGTIGGAEQESATALGFVFATYPVLAAYDDGQGDSASFSYPNSGAPVPVRAGPTGAITLRLSFWRPQRLRLPGEPGTGRWMDVGNLAWTIYGAGGSMHPNCQQADLSDPSDTLQALTASPMPAQDSLAGGYQDVMGDQPASATNTLSFTLNLSACVTRNGNTFAIGSTTSIAVTAVASARDGNLFFTTSWINLRREG